MRQEPLMCQSLLQWRHSVAEATSVLIFWFDLAYETRIPQQLKICRNTRQPRREAEEGIEPTHVSLLDHRDNCTPAFPPWRAL